MPWNVGTWNPGTWNQGAVVTPPSSGVGAQRDLERVKNSPALLVTQRGEQVFERKRIDPEGNRFSWVYDVASSKWKLYAQFPTGAPVLLATEP